MISCSECEHCVTKPDGSSELLCDPFSTVKELECLLKWQLMELGAVARSHKATLDMYRRLAPLQEKLFAHMEREIDEIDEADSWKYTEDEDEKEDSPPGGI